MKLNLQNNIGLFFKIEKVLAKCALIFIYFISMNGRAVAANSNDLVQTPYGLVPQEDVISVNNLQNVTILPNHHVVVADNRTGAIIKDYGLVPPDANAYADDPEGYARKLSGEYSNPPAQEANNNGEGSISDTDLNGYYITAPLQHIKTFSTTWIVPSFPENPTRAQTIFIWNALAGGSLQPVMQWGNGRAHYSIANWAFTGGRYIQGTYIQVNPGTILTGVITFESHDADGWHYKETFLGYPTADLYITRTTEANGLVECVESYTTDHTEFPTNLYTSMYDINVTLVSGTLPQTLSWVGNRAYIPLPSGKNVVVTSNSSTDGSMDFYFH